MSFRIVVVLCALLYSLVAGAAELSTDQQLVRAVMLGNEADVATLIQQGANPSINADALEKDLPYPLLVVAMLTKRPLIAVALLEGGADPNATFDVPGTRNTSTVLNLAIDRRFSPVVEKLLAKGADVNGADSLGNTPLIQVVSNGQLEFLDLLISRGADPHKATSNGINALHYAVAFNRAEAVEKLLAAGADPRIRAGDGRTAMDVARSKGYKDILRMLKEERKRTRSPR